MCERLRHLFTYSPSLFSLFLCDNCFLLLSFSTLTLKLCRCFFGMLFPLPLSPQWSTKALPLAAVLTENDEYNFAVFTVQNTNLKDRNYILS